MSKLAFFDPAFDPGGYFASKINWTIYRAQPGSAIRVPTGHLLGEVFGATTGKAFDAYLVAATQQPAQFFVGAEAAIQSPENQPTPGGG